MRTGVRPLFVVLSLVLVAGCQGNRDQLLADLQSPRPEVRAQAVKALAKQGNADDLVLFTRAAKDMASIVRGEAAEALGESQDPRVVDLLGELLEDQDEDVQGRAAMALSKVKNDKAKAYLTLQYGRRSRNTRQVIVQALKSANVPGAMAEVVAAESKAIWDRNLLTLNEGTLPERVGAAEELGKSGRSEAVNRLLPLVRDSQVILAAAAVRGLGDAGDRRAVAAIAPLLDESFPELREASIGALRKLQDPSSVQRLLAVAMEKSPVSSLAADAIAALPRSPETDAALCNVALEGARNEALSAARAMRSRNGCPVEQIAERLTRPASVENGLRAVIGLGPVAQAALPKVLPLLASPDVGQRMLAVEAVAAIGDASAAPAVQKLYEQELKATEPLRQDWVSAPLPKTYGAGLDPSAPVEERHKHSHSDPEDGRGAKYNQLFDRVRSLNAQRAREAGRVQVEARVPSELYEDVEPAKLEPLAAVLRALGTLKAPGALELLKGYAGDSSVTLRTAALVGLARLGPEGVEAAKGGMFESERDLQKALAQALAEQGEAGQLALVALLPQFSSEKLVLLDALDRFGAPASASEALRTVVGEGGAEAALAANVLGRLKARDAVDTLLKALGEPASVARREVLLALGEIGDTKAAEAVARDLYHDLPDIRAAAATALSRIGTASQTEALDALKSDYYRRVREAAGAALAKSGTATEGAR
ncbi:HEAT repeat domain-containing protein [Hyalangium rubrum]|uniref:HEAT repeat domain-containing protein n=1 Tax=Hyalangium rubrum TaxID=3103134 RepID=A0ABU5HG79_9BACT|nr:HEAT repeat domain-containing protein [Hyalangium sp. s54d21]MDY7231085.1 HEAT repeat domain-containing protein [Hyalangium sp. s54d21]